MIQLLSKADQKALDSINEHIERFVTFFDEVGGKAGTKWDDLVVKHEWNIEIDSALSWLKDNNKIE